MLAYLDELLEPADAQDVGKKIEESDFASSLMHRIRDVTHRMRLAAPRLEGRGMGLDPNTVAEYLDNTLAGERVPDFEKVCLESDVHLAEVAAAHEILALVLGEPAEVEQTLRQRIYDLPSEPPRPGTGDESLRAESGAPPVANAAVGDAGSVPEQFDASIARKKRPKRRKSRRAVEVPDYLREEEEETDRQPWLIAAVVVLLLVGAGLFVQWQWPSVFQGIIGEQVAVNPATSHDEKGGDEKDRDRAIADDSSGKDKSANQSGDVDDTLTDESPESTSDAAQSDHEASAGPEGDKASDEAADSQTQGEKAAGDESTDTHEEAEATRENAAAEANKGDEADMEEEGSDLVRPSADSAAANEDDENAPDAPRPDEKDATDARKAKSATQKAADAPKRTKRAGEVVGRLTTEHDVLLRWEDGTGWVRLPIRETLHAGDRLLVLPTYKPNVALAVGVALQMLGGSEAEIEGPDAQGIPGVRVARGRVVLLPIKPDSQVRLRIGERSGLITFGQDDAPVGVEVVLELPDGADPERETANARAEFYVTTGEIHWAGEKPQGEKVVVETIQGPARRVLQGGPAPAGAEQIDAKSLPAWTGATELEKLEKDASAFLDKELAVERPLTLVLKEVAGHRKIEFSLLAMRSLAEIGEFDSFVPFINNPDQKNAICLAQVDGLHAALARGPEQAVKIRKTYVNQRGKNKGPELYRMLWGYNREQLKGGDDRVLVKHLNDQDVDMRVLSFWNLKRLTGATHGYTPQATEAKRQVALKKWQQKLSSNEGIIPGPGE
jgi:hypothetical protein